MFIAFCYLYRLTPNFTEYHELVFSNTKGIPLWVIEKIITGNLNSRGCFIPDDWQLPNLLNMQMQHAAPPQHQFLHIRQHPATTVPYGDIEILLHTIQLNAAVHKVL